MHKIIIIFTQCYRDIVSYLTGEIDSCPSIEGILTGLSDNYFEKKDHEESIEISEPSSKNVKVDLDEQTLEAEKKMFLERLEGPKGTQPPAATEQQEEFGSKYTYLHILY